MEDIQENYEQQSHGLFIPNEIREIKELCPMEMFVWAVINSYTRWGKHKACWLTNEELGKECDIKAQRTSDIVSHLKKLGLIEQVKFNGRQRVLRSVLAKVYENS